MLHLCQPYRVREISRAADVSASTVSDLIHGRTKLERATPLKILEAIRQLEAEHRAAEERANRILERTRVKVQEEGLRTFAERVGVDHSNLHKALAGGRKPSIQLLALLESEDSGS